VHYLALAGRVAASHRHGGGGRVTPGSGPYSAVMASRLLVSDVDAAADFYTSVIGMRAAQPQHHYVQSIGLRISPTVPLCRPSAGPSGYDTYRNRGSNLTPSCSCRLWNQGTWNQVSDLPAAGVGQGTVLIATG
jgi:hypothetical protein